MYLSNSSNLSNPSNMSAECDYLQWRRHIEHYGLCTDSGGIDPEVQDCYFPEPITEMYTFLGHETLGSKDNEKIYVNDNTPRYRKLPKSIYTYLELLNIEDDEGYSARGVEVYIHVWRHKVFLGFYTPGCKVPQEWISYIECECKDV